MINYNGINTNIDSLLKDQGYSISSIESRIVNIISDNDKFFNIYCAIEGDVSDKKSCNLVYRFVKNFITDFVINNIIKDSDYDYIDIVDNIVYENISIFNSLNDELSCYGDKQIKFWEDDEDDLNSYYYSTRL